MKEYWIIDPSTQTVEQYFHDGKTLKLNGTFGKSDVGGLRSLEGLTVDLSKVFV